MPTLSRHQILMLVTMSVIVIALRALPFLIFRGGKRKLPPILTYLGEVLTAAAIAAATASAGVFPTKLLGFPVCGLYLEPRRGRPGPAGAGGKA